MRTPIVALAALAAVTAGAVGSIEENRKVVPVASASSEPALSEKGARPGVIALKPKTESHGLATARPAVDESALRFFAAQGDSVRLQTEIARLRALYPNWEPPADPLLGEAGGDQRVDELWALYADGRYDMIDQSVAERQKAEPGWMPPADLVEKLQMARARQSLASASQAGDYRTVIAMAADVSRNLTCDDVDALWRVGEAFARTGNAGRARDAYAYVLKNCSNEKERLATVQKASVLLDGANLDDLLRLERPAVDGKAEFDAARDDIARTTIARAAADDAANVPATFIDRLKAVAEREGKASDALLLGWYFHSRKNGPAADDWFRKAYDKEQSAGSARGLALGRLVSGDPARAEDILYPFRDSDEETKAVYLSAATDLLARKPARAISQDVLARMAPVVIAAKNIAAAEQFGWYARALNQPQTAVDWFRAALAWDATYEPAAFGLALALNTMGDKAGLASLQAEWRGRSVRVTSLKAGPAAKPVVAVALKPQRPAATAKPANDVQLASVPARPQQARGCQGSVDLGTISPADALTRGWCLMDVNRPMEAVNAFERAFTGSVDRQRQDAAYGKSLAYLRLKMTDKAAVAAASAPQSPERARELQTAILTDRALGAFRAGRYNETIIALDQRARIAPDRQDLTVLRGFAYQKLGYAAEARRIFQSLASVGNTAARKALADISATE